LKTGYGRVVIGPDYSKFRASDFHFVGSEVIDLPASLARAFYKGNYVEVEQFFREHNIPFRLILKLTAKYGEYHVKHLIQLTPPIETTTAGNDFADHVLSET